MEYFFPERTHRSFNWVTQFLYGEKHKVEWEVSFDDFFTPIPDTVQLKEQINKLPGITDGIWRHRNEFRFGWRNGKSKDEIDIFCYFYIKGKRPSLPDLKESGEIEQDASIVSFLHRPEYYGEMTDENGNSTEGLGEFIIAKNRDGMIGIEKMDVNLATSDWSEYQYKEPSNFNHNTLNNYYEKD